MSTRLTQDNVGRKRAPAQGQRIYFHTGGEGFGLRVTDKGSRSYIFQYRDPEANKTRRRTLGSIHEITFDDAENVAKEMRRAIRDGKAEEMQRKLTYTLRDLRKDYEKIHLPGLKDNTVINDKNAWEKYVAQEKKPRKNEEPFSGPKLADKLVKNITENDIRELHVAITQYGNPYAANLTRMVLSGMFQIAIDKRVIFKNPCSHSGWKKWKNDPNMRDRFLDADELKKLHEYLKSLKGPKSKDGDRQFAAFVELLLLTGCRRGELESATWSQFDLDKCVWTKPASSTKQGEEHRVQIFPEAVAILRELKAGQKVVAMSGDGYVFPADTEAGHIANPKYKWSKLCKACGFLEMDKSGKPVGKANFSPHDCRHTFATWAVKSGVKITTLKELLGHASIEMTSRYYHTDEDDEAEALELMRKESPLIATGPVK